ncbi:unnamed protein product [Clonostachys solani]|uniref:Uncharacterized protein n=1 Tax=Clonostachys solani TaxID=160281 RepID=A0A9N9YYX2_9HYPO|nr:unnamed protein product [Clonostachys solani]
MWDVFWTDPNRELVGEHRARKERKKKQEKLDKRRSVSTKSSSFSSGDSPFSFLRPQNLKRVNTSETGSATPSISSSWLASPTFSSTQSPLSPTFDIPSRPSFAAGRPSTSVERPSTSSHPGELRSFGRGDDLASPRSSQHDSVFSKYPESDQGTSESVRDCSSKEYERSKITIFPRRKSSSHAVASGQAQAQPGQPRRASHSVNYSRGVYGNSHSAKSSLELNAHARNGHPTHDGALIPDPLVPSKTSPKLKIHDPDNWNAIGVQNVTPLLKVTQNSAAVAIPLIKEAENLPSLDECKQEIKWMSAQPLDTILLRLQSPGKPFPDAEGNEAPGPPISRWMLWSLDHLDQAPTIPNTSQSPVVIPMSGASNCLELYDSQETTMFLSAVYPTKKFYHVSPMPLSTELAPNVRPIHINTPTPLKFRGECNYDAAFSFTMPAMCPAAGIPDLLSGISKSLKPGAALRLILVNPMPRAGTVGPHMRAWLRGHLLSNLERSFRCTSPCKLFPEWLGDAGLRGRGSTRTVTKFFAVPASVTHQSTETMDPKTLQEFSESKKMVKAEIRSYLGRELWRQIWGPFLTEGKSWWEDSACVTECLEFGTIWECHTIEAVKGV